MNTSNNRKAALTKKIFQETLVDLLQQYHISEISVKKLCEAADMNRSTFYAHYQNQMSLFEEIKEDVFENLKAFVLESMSLSSADMSRFVFANTLKYIDENANVFKAVFSSGNQQEFNEMLLRLSNYGIVKYQFKEHIENAFELNCILTYKIAGCASVINHWLNNGKKEPIDQVAQILTALTTYPIDLH